MAKKKSEYIDSDLLIAKLNVFWCDKLAIRQISKSVFEQDTHLSNKFSLAMHYQSLSYTKQY